MDVHVYHKVTGPYGTMVFYEGGNLSGQLTLNPASYKAMLGMLDAYSPEEVKVRLIPVPAQFDVGMFAATEEVRR